MLDSSDGIWDTVQTNRSWKSIYSKWENRDINISLYIGLIGDCMLKYQIRNIATTYSVTPYNISYIFELYFL